MIEQALSQFGFTKARSFAIDGGLSGRCWLIISNGNRFILKQYHSRYSDDELSVGLAAQVAATRFRISEPPILAVSGSPLVRIDNDRYMLMPFICGSQLRDNASQTHPIKLAYTVSMLHRSLAIIPEPSTDLHSRFTTLDIAGVENALEIQSRLKTAKRDVILSLQTKLRYLKILARESEWKCATLSQQWIHGDINPTNLIQNVNYVGGIGVIDFDNATWGPTSYEVMRAYMSAFPLYGETEMLSQCMIAYLKEYCKQSASNRVLAEDPIRTYLWYQLCEVMTFIDPHSMRDAEEFAKLKMDRLKWLFEIRHTLSRNAIKAGMYCYDTQESR